MTDVLDYPATEQANKPVKPGIVDCDIHPSSSSFEEFKPFLSKRWWDHLNTYGMFVRQGFKEMLAFPRMQAEVSRLDAWPPSGGPPGSDLDFMRQQHLDPNGVEVGVLIPLRLNSGSQRNIDFGQALVGAVNDWQLEKFCRPEKRLRASIQIAPEDTPGSVAEIERRADDPHFVQILLPPRNGDPIGRERFWPIYEAAVAAKRPIALHVGGVAGHPVSGGTGWPSFYLEEHHSQVQTMQSVIISMVVEGVFERFPALKMVVIEAGFAWLPALAWRLDAQFERMRSEVPHLKRKPSEYIRDHIWFTTQPIEEPDRPDDLTRAMEWVGYDRLMFSTDYPHWDFDDPAHAIQVKLSDENRRKIFSGNAKKLFNLGQA